MRFHDFHSVSEHASDVSVSKEYLNSNRGVNLNSTRSKLQLGSERTPLNFGERSIA